MPQTILSSIATHYQKPEVQLKFHFDDQSVQKLVASTKIDPASKYVKRDSCRITIKPGKKLGRNVKFPTEELLVDTFIRQWWDNGDPCTFQQVRCAVQSH